jgi:hypothetical protein
VSVIIFMLFMGYVTVRTAFWIRGRARLWHLDPSLPRPEAHRPVPDHVGNDAGPLFISTNRARATMTRHHRTVARALIVDPDAALGVVRSAAYRRAVREGSCDLERFLRVLDASSPAVGARLERSAEPERLRRLAAQLAATAHEVSRTRDFEPFPVAQVASVGDCYAAITAELHAIERAIEAPSGHPYRASAPAACG